MTCPVMFVHFGESECLPLAIAQARKFNNAVVTIGDGKDADHAIQESAIREFVAVYRHFSTNPSYFELACFVRWFALRHQMAIGQISHCIYLDSDVLLYADASVEWEHYRQFDFTLSGSASGHTSFWHYSALSQFCEFLMRTYNDDAELQKFETWYGERLATHLPGGVCDMILLAMFAQQSGLKVGETSEIRDGATYDHNVNAQGDEFDMQNGMKRIAMRDGLPYGFLAAELPIREVRFKSIHFQGGAKRLMREYSTR